MHFQKFSTETTAVAQACKFHWTVLLFWTSVPPIKGPHESALPADECVCIWQLQPTIAHVHISYHDITDGRKGKQQIVTSRTQQRGGCSCCPAGQLLQREQTTLERVPPNYQY